MDVRNNLSASVLMKDVIYAITVWCSCAQESELAKLRADLLAIKGKYDNLVRKLRDKVCTYLPTRLF
jgi:hypothetical protein